MTAKLPGRPRDHCKSAAMVAAATEVFFDRGFANTTVEAVAERAGVSKVTIYARFGDKAGLFEAMVKHVLERMQTGTTPQAKLSTNIEDALIRFGKGMMTELLSPQLIAFERNLAGDLARHPDLARRFYEAGAGQSRIRLAAMIKEAASSGELIVEHPMQAAADLHGLWHGFHMIEARFGIAGPPTEQDIENLVKSGVARFLKAYRA